MFDAASIMVASGGLAWTGYQFARTLLGESKGHWSSQRRWIEQERNRRKGVQELVHEVYEKKYHAVHSPNHWRTLVVADIVQESPDTKSFVMVDPAGDLLPSFHAGQHLLVEYQPRSGKPTASGTRNKAGGASEADLSDGTAKAPVRRCYSISHGPGLGFYRITVKRQPVSANDLPTTFHMSHWLHDHIKIGDALRVKGPAGKFTDQVAGDSPVVLLAAGVGITPMISMLESLQASNPTRSIWLFYQVQDSANEILGNRLREIARKNKHFQLHIFHSKFDENASTTKRGVVAGKFNVSHIQSAIQSSVCHIFMCGPSAWMDGMVKQLLQCGHPKERIHWESFGAPSPAPTQTPSGDAASTKSFRIAFQRTRQTARAGARENLLSLAEKAGAAVETGCRSGNCGSCVTRLLQGKARYLSEPHCEVQEGEVVLCVASADSDIVLDA